MKRHKSVIAVLVVILLAVLPVVEAAKGNWKKGRIYYRMVSTD